MKRRSHFAIPAALASIPLSPVEALSHIPATTSITRKRGQEILAGDWYACYEAIKNGKPCRGGGRHGIIRLPSDGRERRWKFLAIFCCHP
jgi:hypothetical protein